MNQFALSLGVVVILLFNVMEVLSMGVLCWMCHGWSSKECACCACDPSVHLGAPSIGFVCVCVCQKIPPHLGD